MSDVSGPIRRLTAVLLSFCIWPFPLQSETYGLMTEVCGLTSEVCGLTSRLQKGLVSVVINLVICYLNFLNREIGE